MKKVISILVIVVMTGSAVFAADQDSKIQRRMNLVKRYLSHKVQNAQVMHQNVDGKTFLTAVRKADQNTIAQVNDLSVILAKDNHGNNCFHLVADVATLQAIAGQIRQLTAAKSGSVEPILYQLRNERNQYGETPFMAQINRGVVIWQLYKNSRLRELISAWEKVNVGGPLASSADVEREKALKESRDNSGRTVAQAMQAMVKDGIGGEPMKEALAFFEHKAPFLL